MLEPVGGVSFDGDADELTAGADAGFEEELLNAGFDGRLGDLQFCGDLFVGEAIEDGAEDVPLAVGEGARSFGGG